MLSREALKSYFVLPLRMKLKEKVLFEGSRVPVQVDQFITTTRFFDWPPFVPPANRIIKNLYLGPMPIDPDVVINAVQKTEGKEEVDAPLKLVMTVTLQSEQAGYNAILPSQWKQLGIKHVSLPIPDRTLDVNDDLLIAAIQMIRTYAEKNSVFIHCKQGIGRSASLCVIYYCFYVLMRKKDFNGDFKMAVTEAEQFVKQQRPQVDLLPVQRERAALIVKKMYELEQQSKCLFKKSKRGSSIQSQDFFSSKPQSEDELKAEKIRKYLYSDELLNAMIHFTFFTELSIHSYLGSMDLFNAIQNFMRAIYEAKNANWYLDLVGRKKLTMKIIKNADSYYPTFYGSSSTDDNEIRERILKQLVDEIHEHMKAKFNCTPSDILQAVEFSKVTLLDDQYGNTVTNLHEQYEVARYK